MGSDIMECTISKMTTKTTNFVPVRTSGIRTMMVHKDIYTGWTVNRPCGRIHG